MWQGMKRQSLRWIGALISLLALTLGGLSAQSAPEGSAYRWERVGADFVRPLFVTHAGDATGRLFVVQQGGKIEVLQGETRQTFLDLTERVSRSANSQNYTEQGLLGLAFHPDYAENGVFFVNYTDRNGTSVVARYRVDPANPQQALYDSEEILLTVQQPFPNHNGGHMAFGPDGYLYVSLGDGGAAGDPLGAGQNLSLLLGKILRLEVDSEGAYSIPADNPFVNQAGALPEIWSYGVRNVWRFSFDRQTGDMYLGDVGQNQWEEINFQAVGQGGANYGWKAYEASTRYDAGVQAPDATLPIFEYVHGNQNGCSVTGGYVYRGEQLPALNGVYFYGDFCSGRIWAGWQSAGTWTSQVFQDSGLSISSFGEDEAGELYVVDYNGAIYRLTAN